MKITHIRINDKTPTRTEMQDIMLILTHEISKANFITEINQTTKYAIKLGQHMRSFSINTDYLPHNVQYNPHRPNGRLTSLPTWDQRVVYNNLVNAVLDSLNVSAMVTSGPFLIREGMNKMTERDWHIQKPEWVMHNEDRGYYVSGPDARSLDKFNKRGA